MGIVGGNMLSRKIVKFLNALFLLLGLSACSNLHNSDEKVNFDKQSAAKSRVELGLAYLAEQNLPLAKVNLEKAKNHQPDYYLPYLGLAYFYQKIGEVVLAEQHYQQALTLSKAQGDVLNNYATFLCTQARFTEAFDFFQQALESDKYTNLADSYENIVLCAYEANDLHRAKIALEKLQLLDSNRAANLQKLFPF